MQLVVRDSEVSYNGGTEIVTGNARDVALESVWLKEDTSPRGGVDLTGCMACTVNEVHSDHACRGVVASRFSTNIRIMNSSFTNSLRTPISLKTGPAEKFTETGPMGSFNRQRVLCQAKISLQR